MLDWVNAKESFFQCTSQLGSSLQALHSICNWRYSIFLWLDCTVFIRHTNGVPGSCTPATNSEKGHPRSLFLRWGMGQASNSEGFVLCFLEGEQGWQTSKEWGGIPFETNKPLDRYSMIFLYVKTWTLSLLAWFKCTSTAMSQCCQIITAVSEYGCGQEVSNSSLKLKFRNSSFQTKVFRRQVRLR